MTLFEYLSVATSIVLALGVSTLISSARHVFAPGRRDWLHIALFILIFFIHLLQWWRLWPLHSVSSWNFLQFLIVMGSPISLYFAATTLVSDAASEISSWRDHLAEVHRWLFATIAIGVFFGMLRITLILDGQFPLILSVVVLAPLLVGAIVRNRSVHIGVVALGWANSLFIVHESFWAGS